MSERRRIVVSFVDDDEDAVIACGMAHMTPRTNLRWNEALGLAVGEFVRVMLRETTGGDTKEGES